MSEDARREADMQQEAAVRVRELARRFAERHPELLRRLKEA
ncbi:hypothetical protein ACFZBU_00850 [Embleya sp. NPDC008237]